MSKPYLNTSQNQQYVRNLLTSNVKSAFTILGGADSVFQLVYNDVLNITAADTNEIQKLVFALKTACLKTLSLNDFENFLICRDGIHFFSKDIFNYVKDGFREDEKVEKSVWEYTIDAMPNEDIRLLLFKGGIEILDIDKVREMLAYIKKKRMYYKLRDNLEKSKIDIKLGDAVSVLLDDENSYDWIDLSNILLFVKQTLNIKDWKEYLLKIQQVYDKRLNPNGLMVLDYMFGVNAENLKSNSNLAEDLYYDILSDLKTIWQLEYNRVSKVSGALPTTGDFDTAIYTRKRNLRE